MSIWSGIVIFYPSMQTFDNNFMIIGVPSQGSWAAIEVSFKILSLSVACISRKLHTAFPLPGKLMQQPFTASIGFT